MTKLMQQKLVVMTQKHDITGEKVLFKVNEDFKNTLIIIGYKRYGIGVTGNSITRTTRTLVKLPTTETDDIFDFLQYYTGEEIDRLTLASDLAKGKQFPVVIDARISTQEFALAIPRYVRGNATAVIDSLEEMLEKYKAFTSVTAKLTNLVRYAVRKSSDKLLKKMIDEKTGFFDVSLLHKLEPSVKAEICSVIDKRLHHGIGKKDINKGILKRQQTGLSSLVTEKGEFILSVNIFVEKEDFEKFPDLTVEHDRNAQSFIDNRIKSATGSILDEMEEETTEEEEETETEEQSEEQGLPAGETVEQETEEEPATVTAKTGTKK